MNILAIDPASALGWAISNDHYGTWDLKTRKDESMGMKLIRLKAKIKEICELEAINLIVYERPGGRHKNPIIHQSKLIAVIETYCEENKIQYRAYSSTELKKFATGKGNVGKLAMIDAATERLGYEGNDDNEADALWCLAIAREEYCK